MDQEQAMTASDSREATHQSGLLRGLFVLARPKQWVKNAFVFVALIFAGKLSDVHAIWHAVIAFCSFCLVSSAVYYLNDFRDIDEDRQHPLKKDRPLASNAVPTWVGLFGSLLLAGAAIAVSATVNYWTLVTALVYLFVNIGYSFGLKHLVIIDVFMIATGFVLRIVAGAAAISVMPSTWLILCAVTLSLFLGYTKRRSEVVMLNDKATAHRKVLAHYSTPFLDQMISVTTAATIVLYILYTVDARTVALVGSHGLVLSVPFVLYGLFRYLYLVYHVKSAHDPTQTVLTDIPLLVTGALWAATCAAAVFVGSSWIDLLR